MVCPSTTESGYLAGQLEGELIGKQYWTQNNDDATFDKRGKFRESKRERSDSSNNKCRIQVHMLTA